MSDRHPPSPEEESTAPRAEPEPVPAAGREAPNHLREGIDSPGEEGDGARDADSVTTQVALEQELDTIRRTLRDKERLLEDLALQCRRLEDELEDQHLANEELERIMEGKQHSLTAAREQVERLSRERREIEARYRNLLSLERPKKIAGGRAGRAGSGRTAAGRGLIWGSVAAVLLAAVALAAWLHLGSPPPSDAHSRKEPEAASPSYPSPTTAPPVSSRVQGSVSRPVAGGMQSRAVARIEVRDRLSDGSAGPLMLKIEGGGFTMGRRLALPDEDDGPAHNVHLESFLIGATEVTFEEYDRFARATGRRFPRDFGWGRGKRPVVDVSWEDARAYMQWLSRRTGKRYRLPSESEWEYAAAGRKTTFFWWGIHPGHGRAVCYDCGTRWDNRSSAPVASFQPNPYGLYDTAGNVMEWVEDCYHPDYIGAPPNGDPWGRSDCELRVARGGAFNKPARSMHSTARHSFAPETRLNALGFRVARDE